jgi:hypothetical protein
LGRTVPLVGFPLAVAVAAFTLNFTGTLGEVSVARGCFGLV